MMEDSTAARFHGSITRFKTYEDYLDSKVTRTDLLYLQVSDGHRSALNRHDKLSIYGCFSRFVTVRVDKTEATKLFLNCQHPAFHSA